MKRIFAWVMSALFALTSFLFSCIPAAAATIPGVEAEVYTNPDNGHLYYLTDPQTWTEAQAEAQSLGGNLVTINDEAEQDWLWSAFGRALPYWIGLNDAQSEGSFQWISGEPFEYDYPYDYWTPEDPSGGDEEDYLVMNFFTPNDPLGGWADVGNDGPNYGEAVPGIVELDALPVAVTGAISGLKWDDLNGNGKRDGFLISGDSPDVLFVLDLSRSTIRNQFKGTAVGDVNGTEGPNTILDGELAGFIALNQQLIDQGLDKTARVGMIIFASSAYEADMDATTPGKQLVTFAGADLDGNHTPDVVDVLTSIQAEGRALSDPYDTQINGKEVEISASTNFTRALQSADGLFSTIETQPGQGNLIFLSDGKPDRRFGDYTNEVAQLKRKGINLSAFGVGKGASLKALHKIDSDGEIFITTNELLDIFSGLKGTQKSELEPILPGLTVYLDLNHNGVKDEAEPAQITDESGHYQFSDLTPGTYTVQEVIPKNFIQSFPAQVHEIVVEADATVSGVNFGNAPL